MTAGTGAAQSKPDRANEVWPSQNRYCIRLTVDPRRRARSNSPVSLELDFQATLRRQNDKGIFDESTIEVVALDASGTPKVFDPSRPPSERRFLPWRIDQYFGTTKVTFNFAMPSEAFTDYVVYFDTVESGKGKPRRPRGIVGDGDRFTEQRKRREIAASHFDQFCDFDGDGDLDLFKGGVEPFVYCYENVGGNRLVDRGRLASAGSLLTLPRGENNRSWVTVAFYDWDGDGDQDFFPSFGDGPDRGRIVFYRNTTREHQGQLTFSRVGPLKTVSGTALAGEAQAGGWFPSITFVKDWDGDGDGHIDLLVGSNNHCYLYRNLGVDADGLPQLADAVAVRADGQDVTLINPRFECADIDGDGDLDLLAGTQPGPIYSFKNIGSRKKPAFAKGTILACDGKYLIGDAHSGVTVGDFNGDHLPDIVVGRFWERTDLANAELPREYGGFHVNIGTLAEPRFQKSAAGSPHTEHFQICDAIRQNCVRAVDWDQDGKLDLLAGDTDGFIWFLRNETGNLFPVFAAPDKLQAGGKLLSVSQSGGHARLAICDWNNDGFRDLMVADGNGTLNLLLNEGSKGRPKLKAGIPVQSEGKPLQGHSRASVLVCDWNSDGKKDILLADAEGYWFYHNTGSDAQPVLAAAKAISFDGRRVSYVRPNLGSFIDWDGDGRKDFIGCHFENSIRFYKNVGTGAREKEPLFTSPEGKVIVQSWTPQMISGADAIDWNGDGDIDILTGQGHGGSGLRFFERDYTEDELNNTHPAATITGEGVKPAAEKTRSTSH